MLSRKVVCAILILNELYGTSVDPKSGYKLLRRSTLMKYCSWDDHHTFKRVLQQLMHSGYVQAVSFTKVALTCNPCMITIFELFEVIHAGVPLGEELRRDHDERFYTDDKYRKIKFIEKDTIALLRDYFGQQTVASAFGRIEQRNTAILTNERTNE